MNQSFNYSQRVIQLYLICIASREEIIFHLRIMVHQFDQTRTNVRAIIEEILKGENERVKIESNCISQFNETMRKFLVKISQRANKIQSYYLNKIQTYFPRQGQMLAHEFIQANLSLKQGISLLSADPNKGCDIILNHISNYQKQRLKNELARLQITHQQDRCNRNEKFFTMPLIQGVVGIQYINQLHQRYYFGSAFKSNRFVYDILPMDEHSKSLSINGPGFKNYVTSVSSLEKTQQVSFYIPIESSIEIITQRYDKLFKELQENNQHISKAIQQYQEQFLNKKKSQISMKTEPQRVTTNIVENLNTTSRTSHSFSQMIFRPRDASCSNNLNTQNIIYEPKLRPAISQAVKSRKEREVQKKKKIIFQKNDSLFDSTTLTLQARYPQYELYKSSLKKRENSGFIQPPLLPISQLGNSYLLHGISILSTVRRKHAEDESIRYSQTGNVFRVQRTSNSLSAIRGK